MRQKEDVADQSCCSYTKREKHGGQKNHGSEKKNDGGYGAHFPKKRGEKGKGGRSVGLFWNAH